MPTKEEPEDVLTLSDVNAAIKKALDKIELPNYEDQIKKLNEELNTTRTAMNKANEDITALTTKLNQVISDTDSKIEKLKPPKKEKGFLDMVVLPE
jgi:uncharacterized coiled-coil protein SlyX